MTCAALLLFLLHHAPAQGAEAGKARFVTPWPGALIAAGPVLVAGTVPSDARQTHFLLNGRLVGGIRREGARFSGSFVPPDGFNEFEVRFGEGRAMINFVYGVDTAGQAPYSYHEPLLKGECARCHDGEGGGEEKRESRLCYQCHPSRETLYPYVHGPVGAGKCLVCHDPHGSGLPALTLEKPAEMCTACHDQKPSMTGHVSNARSRVCTLCHAPHYALKRYLLRGEDW